jgi:hypothetical protein
VLRVTSSTAGPLTRRVIGRFGKGHVRFGDLAAQRDRESRRVRRRDRLPACAVRSMLRAVGTITDALDRQDGQPAQMAGLSDAGSLHLDRRGIVVRPLQLGGEWRRPGIEDDVACRDGLEVHLDSRLHRGRLPPRAARDDPCQLLQLM